MHARYYHAALGRFVSADTIVPGVANSQDWNRYAYTRNNPVRYTDPTGHYIFDEDYLNPTSATYSLEFTNYADTYFLGPRDARAILGGNGSSSMTGETARAETVKRQNAAVSVPMRIRQGYVGELNDPNGLAMPIIAFGMALCGAVAGLPMPTSSTQYHVPASLTSDAIGDPDLPGYGPRSTTTNPYQASHRGRIHQNHIDKQQGVGNQLYDNLTGRGHDVEVRYDKSAYDLKTGLQVSNPSGNRVYADVQAFDVNTGAPPSMPYEIEWAGGPNWGIKNTNYGVVDYVQVTYNR